MEDDIKRIVVKHPRRDVHLISVDRFVRPAQTPQGIREGVLAAISTHITVISHVRVDICAGSGVCAGTARRVGPGSSGIGGGRAVDSGGRGGGGGRGVVDVGNRGGVDNGRVSIDGCAARHVCNTSIATLAAVPQCELLHR